MSCVLQPNVRIESRREEEEEEEERKNQGKIDIPFRASLNLIILYQIIYVK